MTAKRLNLALQGGGSHGAFTWGVLDALLADGDIEIAGISGTSAGAMNGAAVAHGMATGGRKGGAEAARAALEALWKRVSDLVAYAPVPASAYDTWFGNFSLLPGMPKINFLSQFAHAFSPYNFNPSGLNPLRGITEDLFDFDAIRRCRHLKLHVAATNVFTGKVRIFGCKEMSPDVLAASACLPQFFQAVTIEDEPYWDGGYMGNPALFPLYDDESCRDILLVQVNPVERREVPKTREEIDNRVDEIAFSGALLRELRAVEFVQRLMDSGTLNPGEGYSRLRLHRVGGDELTNFGAASKVRTDWGFLTELRDLGRASAENWLSSNRDAIGERDTLDLRAMFG